MIKMEIHLENVCVLCEEITAVLKLPAVANYTTCLYNTFFEKNKNALQEFRTNASEIGLCVLCSHQIVIAHKFKKSFEDMCEKEMKDAKAKVNENVDKDSEKKSETTCLLCEQKGVEFVGTVANPNNFNMMVTAFMDATMYPKPYLQSLVCFDCIFYLSIWFKIYTYLQKKCHISVIQTTISTTPATRTKAQKKVHFDEDDTVIEINGSTSRSSPRKRSPPPPTRPRNTRNSLPKRKPGPLSAKKTIGPRRSKMAFKKLLQLQLKHLKSVKQLKRKCWPDILRDRKMYTELPYVLLSPELNVINLTRELSNSPDLIEISDSDESVSDEVDNKPTAPKKVGFKIKMSSKFLSRPKSKANKRRLKNTEYQFICDVCDKTITSLSEYKMHALWHKKPERPIVNIIRSNFAASISVKDEPTTDENRKDDSEVESATIDKINDAHESETNEETKTDDEESVATEQLTKESDVEVTVSASAENESKIVENEEDTSEVDTNTTEEINTSNKETVKNDAEDDKSETQTSEDNNLNNDVEQSENNERVVSPGDDKQNENETLQENTNIDENNSEQSDTIVEDINSVVEPSVPVHNTGNGEVDSDVEQKEIGGSNEKDDSILPTKKRNHDKHINDISIVENGNDDDIHDAKRAKFTDDSCDFVQDIEKCGENAIET